jgi:simple sugar transport system ATP-binding protein
MGINVRDAHQPIGTMSGGEKQCLAIARAIHFGARVLILDEPTAALGVKQSFNVLKLIHTARAKGISVIFITHNVHHAYPIGDSFTLLNRGKSMGTFTKDTITKNEVLDMMAGGAEMQQMMNELEDAPA